MRERGDLRDPRLEAAFLRVPREAFLPGLPPEQVYADEAIPIRRDPDGTVISSSSQPSMMALMIEQLRVQPNMNVLEIGAGSGYNAAILQALLGPTGRVTTVEVDPVVAHAAKDNLQRAAMGEVDVVTGDGAMGYSPRAAYDRIIATAGVWDIPRAWVRQLKPRGLIVAPIWLEGYQYSAAFHLQPDGSLYSERNLPCGFIRMRGLASGPPVELRVTPGAMIIYSTAASRFDPASINMLSGDNSEGYVGTRVDAREWAGGASLYVLLTLPEPYVVGSYWVADGQMVYGAEGNGMVVMTRGSICFVPTRGRGEAIVLGSADSLLAVQDALSGWEAAGRPGLERLRLRLTPLENGRPTVQGIAGRVLTRDEHTLEAWLV